MTDRGAVSAGTVRIAGEAVNAMPPRKRDLAMVFQSYALYPHMTVRDNLTYALRLRRLAKAEIARQADGVAAITGLSPLMDRYPRELSGGQRQRVAMGRAIIRHPEAFLFDEPLSNLDASLRVAMRWRACGRSIWSWRRRTRCTSSIPRPGYRFGRAGPSAASIAASPASSASRPAGPMRTRSASA